MKQYQLKKVNGSGKLESIDILHDDKLEKNLKALSYLWKKLKELMPERRSLKK